MSRTHPDRCPGVLRPWIADDGALIRIRLTGGAMSTSALAALARICTQWGDGNLHLTKRANVQMRAFPHDEGCIPAPIVEAITAAGLLPTPSHELVRNIMISPLTGREGGRTDVRPIARDLDEQLCADPAFATLAGRFLFVLDDGRGDLVDRSLDLGLMAIDDAAVQIRIGSLIWGPVVPCADAASVILTIARRFLAVRGSGETALWHVDELADGGASLVSPHHARDLRTQVTSLPAPYGIIDQDDGRQAQHIAVPGGVLTPSLIGETLDLAGPELIVTPWRSIIAPDLETI